MKNPALIVAMAAALLAAAAPAQDGAAPAGQEQTAARPRLVVDKESLDFGRVLDTETRAGEFVVRNDGDADLVISGVESTCGCTVPRLGGVDTSEGAARASVTLAPGESTVIEVGFNPAGKRDRQDQKVTVKSNDPDRPRVELSVLAFVEPIVRVDPPAASFGEVVNGHQSTLTVTVIGRTPDFTVRNATVSGIANGKTRVKVGRPVDDEIDGEPVRRVEVQFTFTAERPGKFGGVGGIRTTDPRRAFATVDLTGEVVGEFAVAPSPLQVGIVPAGAEVERPIKVRNRLGKPFKILDIAARQADQSPAWRVEPPSEESEDDAQVVMLTFKAPESGGPWRGVLLLTTDAPDQEPIEVPFNATIRAGRTEGPDTPRSPLAPPK